MANFPSVTAAGAFESTAVQNAIKALARTEVTADLTRITYNSGSRDISGLLQNSAASGSSPRVILQRVGNTVMLNLNGVSPTEALASGGAFLTLPVGFRPSTNLYLNLSTAQATATRSAYIYTNGAVGVWTPAVSDSYRTLWTYLTTDNPPSAPPGAPA